MQTKRTIAMLLAIFALNLSPASLANNTKQESLQACTAKAGDKVSGMLSCQQFVAGFMQGALLTDAAIIARFSTDSALSDFANRALETRVGGRLKSLPVTYFASFCLPKERAYTELISQLTAQMMSSSDSSEAPGQRLYSLLKQQFPCSADL